MDITLTALRDLPTIEAGDDLAAALIANLEAIGGCEPGDVIAVVSKVVGRAEDRFVDLGTVQPDPTAVKMGRAVAKDPRLVQLILSQSEAVSRASKGVLIVRHKLGFIAANAGIDASNIGRDGDWVLLLPEDPDASAQRLRMALEVHFGMRLGVLISDSHGRPFRLGAMGIAIGVAGLPALLDRRRTPDRFGRLLEHTEVPLADQLATAADLVAGPGDEGIAAVRLRGIDWNADEASHAAQLQRPAAKDLYG